MGEEEGEEAEEEDVNRRPALGAEQAPLESGGEDREDCDEDRDGGAVLVLARGRGAGPTGGVGIAERLLSHLAGKRIHRRLVTWPRRV